MLVKRSNGRLMDKALPIAYLWVLASMRFPLCYYAYYLIAFFLGYVMAGMVTSLVLGMLSTSCILRKSL